MYFITKSNPLRLESGSTTIENKTNRSNYRQYPFSSMNSGRSRCLGVMLCFSMLGVLTPIESANAKIIAPLWSDKDSYIRADLDVRQNDNYGGEAFIAVGNGREGPDQAADKMRSLLGFGESFTWLTAFLGKTPGLAYANSITNATLELTISGYDHGSSSSVYNVGAYGILGNWNEGLGAEAAGTPPGDPQNVDTAPGVDWLNQPGSAGPFSTSTIKQGEAGMYDLVTWDVTSLVKIWAMGNTPFSAENGIMLKDLTPSNVFQGIRFFSNEGTVATPSFNPTLRVTVPEPNTGFLLGIAVAGLILARRGRRFSNN